MTQPPAGTVTFAFTDIEGSTRLLQELGDEAYGRLSGDHRRLVRETFGARGGTEVDTQGDAFFLSFPRARDAVAAAVDAQRALRDHDWPDGKEVRVRMGLHTGEPHVGEEGYLGLDVVRAPPASPPPATAGRSSSRRRRVRCSATSSRTGVPCTTSGSSI
jgi:class 3 adenylate cyclase